MLSQNAGLRSYGRDGAVTTEANSRSKSARASAGLATLSLSAGSAGASADEGRRRACRCVNAIWPAALPYPNLP